MSTCDCATSRAEGGGASQFTGKSKQYKHRDKLTHVLLRFKKEVSVVLWNTYLKSTLII